MIAAGILLAAWQAGAESCGTVFTVATHNSTTMLYSLAQPATGPDVAAPTTLALLPGGGGHLDLDAGGCPKALTGNSLVRMRPLFQQAGFAVALVDSPSDHIGEDGLKGFRTDPRHAEDLGRVILDLRHRIGGPVWLVGTSRGSISAVNAASRLRGPVAPDGLVLTSALMDGDSFARKAWVAQTVFDLPLAAIATPVLLVGHEDDTCIRSPSDMMAEVAARLGTARRQVAVVTGGPGGAGASQDIESCRGQSPHGFFGQEDEVAAGIARFVRGGAY
jgi:pimeloyl-ACP methyl ester carboxylesterase